MALIVCAGITPAYAHDGHEHDESGLPENQECVTAEVFVNGQGESCRTESGDWKLELADGKEVLTHGPDPVPNVLGTGPNPTPPPTADKTDIHCAAAADKAYRVVYARPPGTTDNYSSKLSTIRDRVYQASAYLNEEAQATDSSREWKIKFRCDASSDVIVDNVVLTTAAANDTFGSIVSEVRAENGSLYNVANNNVLVFLDGDVGGSKAGEGTHYTDEDKSYDNASNTGTTYAAIYWVNSDWWFTVTLHEMSHNMGAVQDGAPNTSGAGHCNDGQDIMCYDDLGPDSDYSDFICATQDRFDCNGDDYFNPLPANGSYLDDHWNMADDNNHWLRITSTGSDTEDPVLDYDWPTTTGYAGKTIPIAATDNIAVDRVEVVYDGNTAGKVTAYGKPWNPSTMSVSDGAHTADITVYDTAGNAVTQTGVSINVDHTNPGAVTAINGGLVNGTSGTWSNSTTQLSANWPTVSDASGTRYKYCITPTLACNDLSHYQLGGETIAGGYGSVTVTGISPAMTVGSTQYKFCIITYDEVGNTSNSYVCQVTGQKIDITNPNAASSVKDGATSPTDLVYATSLTQLGVNWTASTGDPGAAGTFSGLSRYEYCISTATQCGGTIVKNWTSVGTAVSVTATGLTLVDHTLYYACVRTFDNAGNMPTPVCSGGQTVDVSAPAVPATMNDGSGADASYLTSTSTLTANWTPAADAGSGVTSYEWCISTGDNCTGTVVQNWTTAGITIANPVTATKSGLSLIEGTLYYACTRSTNGVNLVSNVECTDGQTVDASPPPAPSSVNDGLNIDVTYQSSTSTINANAPAVTDSASGVASYQWCISATTDCGGVPVQNWNTAGVTLGTPVTFTNSGLTLSNGLVYYVCVKATNGAGQTGTHACSNGVTVDNTAPTAPASANDGAAADIAYQMSTSAVSANWPAASDAQSGIGSYEWCISTVTDCGGTPVMNWTASGITGGTPNTASKTGLTLSDGSTYYVCARAINGAGTPGATACTNGVLVDATAPTAATPVRDGATAPTDLVYQTASATSLGANWVASSGDPGGAGASGIGRYDWCLSTQTGCAGTVVQNWTSVALATDANATGLTLVEGTTYFACVRTVDNAGNPATAVCSNGQVLDATGPVAPASANDGIAADVTYTSSTSVLNANWPAVTDAGSGVTGYEWCISSVTDCGGTPVLNWTATGITTGTPNTATKSGLTLTPGTTYYVCAKANNGAGLPGTAKCTNGITVDTSAPGAPASINDGTGADVATQSSTSVVNANWPAATDAESSVASYQWCISSVTSCGGTPVHNWTTSGVTLGTPVTSTVSGLSLVNNVTYYVCAKAINGAGLPGSYQCSNGVKVVTSPPPAPASANDGSGADITWSSSTSELAANWPVVTGSESTVTGYEWCIATTSDCSGTPEMDWTASGISIGSPVSATKSGLTLANGPTYYVCARAVNDAAMAGAARCTNGVTIDSTAPAAPASASDGSAGDLTYQSSGSVISSNWPAVTDSGSGVTGYEWCISTVTSCGGTPVVNWTSTGITAGTPVTATKSALSLTSGSTYFVCARAINGAGLPGSVACTNGVTVDVSAPPAPSTAKDGLSTDVAYSTSASSLSANWPSVTDTISGVTGYEWCISTVTNCGGTPLMNWTSTGITAGATVTATATGLSAANGSLYYTCARAINGAGLPGSMRCTNGVKVDTTAPAAPASANDSLSADATYQTVATTIQANWPAVTDAESSVTGYQWCISTVTNCGGTPLVNWTATGVTVGTPVTASRTGLGLANGTTYYVCAKAINGAGAAGAVVCTNGVTVDTSAPAAPASANDGAGSDAAYTTSTDALSANWPAVTDAQSSVTGYEWCISTVTSCGGTPLVNWTSAGVTLGTPVAASATGLTLAEGSTYFICAKAINAAGLPGAARCTNGITVDSSAPSAPTSVSDGTAADVAWSVSNSALAANWPAATDAESSVASYEWCVSTVTDCGGTPVMNWTSSGVTIGTPVAASKTGLTLDNGTTYFVCVKAINGAGTPSTVSCSDGVTVDSTAPAAPAAASDGTGTDAAWLDSTVTLAANWTAVTDADSSISDYEWCISTVTGCGGTPLQAWTSTGITAGTPVTAVKGSLALSQGTKYFVCARAINGAGMTGAMRCTNGQTVDTVAPSSPAPVRDGSGDEDKDYSNVSTALTANWNASGDASSGLATYQWCVSKNSTCAADIVHAWSDAGIADDGLGQSGALTSLALTDGSTYYTCVRVFDAAGHSSDEVCSDGMTIDKTLPQLAVATLANPTALKGTIALSATATDDRGVARVEVLLDNTVIATDVSAPYAVNWNSATVSDGLHTLTLRAFDFAGNVKVSSQTVKTTNTTAPATPPPSPTPPPAPAPPPPPTPVAPGTPAGDNINGTPKSDLFKGLAGNDIFSGFAGNDSFFGGAGNDKAVGGIGNDKLNGGLGIDKLFGGAGKDILLGGAGNDILDGGAGDDTLVGGAGKDIMKGSAGNDIVNANDSKPGDTIDCGVGIKDVATVNKGDTVKNCEKVTYK